MGRDSENGGVGVREQRTEEVERQNRARSVCYAMPTHSVRGCWWIRTRFLERASRSYIGGEECDFFDSEILKNNEGVLIFWFVISPFLISKRDSFQVVFFASFRKKYEFSPINQSNVSFWFRYFKISDKSDEKSCLNRFRYVLT
jgi:hypothetical protein